MVIAGCLLLAFYVFGADANVDLEDDGEHSEEEDDSPYSVLFPTVSFAKLFSVFGLTEEILFPGCIHLCIMISIRLILCTLNNLFPVYIDIRHHNILPTIKICESVAVHWSDVPLGEFYDPPYKKKMETKLPFFLTIVSRAQ